MSVIVKDMELPKNCYSCDFANFLSDGEPYCRRTMGRCTLINLVRPGWCPLEEIPTPHGDLIDRDELLKNSVTMWEDALETYDSEPIVWQSCIEDVDTIVKKEVNE